MTSGQYNRKPMESPRHQLSKAREKFNLLKPAFEKYATTNPFTVVTERSSSTGVVRTCLRRVKSTPITLADAVNDAFEPLRKALDHVGYAVAKATGQRGKKCAFPFGDTERELRARGATKGSSSEIPPEVFELLVSFHPYKDGDQRLWALNEIANASKHRMVMAFPASPNSTSLHVIEMIGSGKLMYPWNEEAGEMVIAEVHDDTLLSIDELSYRVHLVFGDIPVVGGQPIEPIFYYLEAKVKEILDSVEGMAKHLKLFSQ